MWMDLVGTWSGALSLAVILICAIGIPGAVTMALMRQVKGPIEREQESPTKTKHSAWYARRYAH